MNTDRYLFRGQDYKGKWVYGSLITYPSSTQIGVLQSIDSMIFVKVKPETVGQFTGLFDKNGTKVFEGDLLNVYEYTVTFKDGCFCAIKNQRLVRFWLNSDSCNLEAIEVIGNIHDKK